MRLVIFGGVAFSGDGSPSFFSGPVITEAEHLTVLAHLKRDIHTEERNRAVRIISKNRGNPGAAMQQILSEDVK